MSCSRGNTPSKECEVASWPVCIRPVPPTAQHCLAGASPASAAESENRCERESPRLSSVNLHHRRVHRVSAGLLLLVWQKGLVIKVDPPTYLRALTKNALSRRCEVSIFHQSVNKCLLNTSWVLLVRTRQLPNN